MTRPKSTRTSTAKNKPNARRGPPVTPNSSARSLTLNARRRRGIHPQRCFGSTSPREFGGALQSQLPKCIPSLVILRQAAQASANSFDVVRIDEFGGTARDLAHRAKIARQHGCPQRHGLEYG